MKNPRIFTLLDLYCVSVYDEDGNMELLVKKRKRLILGRLI